MSLLVDSEILKAVRENEIKISPFSEENIQPAAYQFTLGNIFLIPKLGQSVSIKDGPDPDYEKVVVEERGHRIKPGEFILAQTKEILTISNSIAMMFGGRSTLARLGLSVHQTASLILPGHTDSIITMEIFNAGPITIQLVPGEKIAKGVFFKTNVPSSISYKDSGIYEKQAEVEGADLPPVND